MKKKLIALLLSCAMLTGILSGVASFADENTADEVVGAENTDEIIGDNNDDNPDNNIYNNNIHNNEEKLEGDIDDTLYGDDSQGGTSETDAPKNEANQGQTGDDGESGGDGDFYDNDDSLESVEVIEKSDDEPVPSEIVYVSDEPTIDMTDVAPYLDPVIGDSSLWERSLINVQAMNDAIALYEGEGETENKSGLELSKTATANDGGTYTIRLEAYAPGSSETTTTVKDVPTDFILVLDQSGSMADDMGKIEYKQYENIYYWNDIEFRTRNQDYYKVRHNDGGSANLWYKVGDKYYSVSVVKNEVATYIGLSNYTRNDISIYGDSVDGYYQKQGMLYEYDKESNEYIEVEIGIEYGYPTPYIYKFENGDEVTSRGEDTRPYETSNPEGVFKKNAPLYYKTIDESKTQYTYTYTDENGETQTIGTWPGDEERPEQVFYEKVTEYAGIKKITALKTAVTSFAKSVAEKAAGADKDINTADDNVNHRIAIVGFASESGYGNNTELLSIRGRNSGNVGVAYNDITAQNLKYVVQSMDTSAGKTMVTNAIDALATNGATRVDLGLDMAERILNANPVKDGEKRNRVVIVFTDGSPTDFDGFKLATANAAINKADSIKESGATVYSIGIFAGADATSAGSEPSGDLGQSSRYLAAACNWFMQNISSNNGTPQTPSYYLSASDSEALKSVFQQISDKITDDRVLTELGKEAVIKDIVSPYFTVPGGADQITVKTADYIGNNKFSEEQEFKDAVVTNVDGVISVSNFDFKENWCGTIRESGKADVYHGKKLIIEFTVSPKPGFLGGNNVPTNDGAYVYENGNPETKPCGEFTPPAGVDVDIPDTAIGLSEIYTYLENSITKADLINKTTITYQSQEKTFKITKDANGNWGPEEEWMDDYVDITVNLKYKDKDGNYIEIPGNGIIGLADDTEYKVEVTISPRNGTANPNGEEKPIKVFKPEITWQDSEINLGETANYEDNFVSIVWKHDDTTPENVSESAKVIGEAPTLRYEYSTPEAAFTVDTSVKVTVKLDTADGTDITEYVKFVHDECDYSGCEWNKKYAEGMSEYGKAHFIVHVKSFNLTIIKTGWEDIDENQSFVFTIQRKDDDKWTDVMQVVINQFDSDKEGSVTIKNLPSGEYQVVEETGWSWRYTPDGDTKPVGIENGEATVTFANTRAISPDGENLKWLNGCAYADNRWNSNTPIKSPRILTKN